MGIEDPLREGVRKAVEDCQKAGVAVKICTGDNVLTACSITTKCGIFMAGGVITEGPVFRLLEALGLFNYIVVLYSEMFEYDLGPQIIYVVYIMGMASDTRGFKHLPMPHADPLELDIRDSYSIIQATN